MKSDCNYKILSPEILQRTHVDAMIIRQGIFGGKGENENR